MKSSPCSTLTAPSLLEEVWDDFLENELLIIAMYFFFVSSV